MPNEMGRLAGVAIARSRRHYVAYGVDADRLAGGAGLHGVLSDVTSYSPAGVVRLLNERLSMDGLRAGMPFLAHRTGGNPVCFRERTANARCEQRFVPLARDFDGPAFLAVPLAWVPRMGAADLSRLPPSVRVALQVPAAAPRGPISSVFAMPSGLYTDTPPASDLPAGIESFGVELESVVPTSIVDSVDSFVSRCGRADVASDGSITFWRGVTAREYTFWSTSIAEVSAWLSTLYAGGLQTNSSCGFHVHVKPQAGRRWVAATRFYWDSFASAYHAWARTQPSKFAERETAQWCEIQPWTRTRVGRLLRSTENRYTAINLSSLLKHSFGTIEHRILPYQASAAEAERSLRWLLTTSAGLFATKPVPVEQDAELDLLAESPALCESVYYSASDLRTAISAASIPRASTPTHLPWRALRAVSRAVDVEA